MLSLVQMQEVVVMSKHTPGPWHVDTSSISQFNIVDSNLFVVCDTICGEEKSDEVNEANAKLIAAAPEMLEILERAYKTLRPIIAEIALPSKDHLMGSMNAVIKKAKGETI